VPDGFGLDNLPFGVFREPGGEPRVGVRFDDAVIDLAAALPEPVDGVWRADSLNPFLSLGRGAWEEVRDRVRELADSGSAPLLALADVVVECPVRPGDYVDFYSSIEHATNLGRLFRPDADPLLPNWRWLPVGYHGRSSSVVASDTPVPRPAGQLPPEDGGAPSFGPTRRLDFELELGFVTGPGNPLGSPIPVEQAREHIFGVVLVNDWSARDIQRWEYQPLGPFLGKSFATSISPWVVPLDALEPYRVPGPVQDPEPLGYLRTVEPWAFDIALEVELNGTPISRTNARGLYWSFAQQLAHATVNGANARAGDLYASGTISGSDPGSYGSLIELTSGGRRPLRLADGSERTFLEDGDEVVMRGLCEGRGPTIDLGEVRGTVAAPTHKRGDR